MADWRDDHDYPMSWDCYRALCYAHGERDPGPLEPPESDPKITELEARVSKLEEEHYIKLATAVMKAPVAKETKPKFKGVQPI